MTHELIHRVASKYAERAARAYEAGRYEDAKGLYHRAVKLELSAMRNMPRGPTRFLYARNTSRWLMAAFHHLFTDA